MSHKGSFIRQKTTVSKANYQKLSISCVLDDWKWDALRVWSGGASRNRTTDTWIFSTMLYTMYQALTGISDQIETISVSQFVPVCPVMPNELYTQTRCKSMSWSHVILVSNNILSLEILCDIACSNFIPILSLMRFTVVLSLQRSGWLLQVYHFLEIVLYNVCRWCRRGSGNGSEEDGCG